MSDRLPTTVGCVVLFVWMICVLRNVWTDGTYRIPTEVTSALMAVVTCLFSVDVFRYFTRRNGK